MRREKNEGLSKMGRKTTPAKAQEEDNDKINPIPIYVPERRKNQLSIKKTFALSRTH